MAAPGSVMPVPNTKVLYIRSSHTFCPEDETREKVLCCCCRPAPDWLFYRLIMLLLLLCRDKGAFSAEALQFDCMHACMPGQNTPARFFFFFLLRDGKKPRERYTRNSTHKTSVRIIYHTHEDRRSKQHAKKSKTRGELKPTAIKKEGVQEGPAASSSVTSTGESKTEQGIRRSLSC